MRGLARVAALVEHPDRFAKNRLGVRLCPTGLIEQRARAHPRDAALGEGDRFARPVLVGERERRRELLFGGRVAALQCQLAEVVLDLGKRTLIAQTEREAARFVQQRLRGVALPQRELSLGEMVEQMALETPIVHLARAVERCGVERRCCCGAPLKERELAEPDLRLDGALMIGDLLTDAERGREMALGTVEGALVELDEPDRRQGHRFTPRVVAGSATGQGFARRRECGFEVAECAVNLREVVVSARHAAFVFSRSKQQQRAAQVLERAGVLAALSVNARQTIERSPGRSTCPELPCQVDQLAGTTA